jgi:hypothetical protein
VEKSGDAAAAGDARLGRRTAARKPSLREIEFEFAWGRLRSEAGSFRHRHGESSEVDEWQCIIGSDIILAGTIDSEFVGEATNVC